MKIQLKRSNLLVDSAAKPPTAGQMEYGELAVNYSEADPTLFYKDDKNTIRKLKLGINPDLGKVELQEGTLDDRYLTLTGGVLKGNLIGKEFIGGVVRISDSPPSSNQPGELWYNTNNGRTYVFYEDANGDSQWVDAAPDTFAITDLYYTKQDSDRRFLRSGETLVTFSNPGTSIESNFAINVGVDSDKNQGVRIEPLTEGSAKNGKVTVYVNPDAQSAGRDVIEVKDEKNNSTTLALKASGAAKFVGGIEVGGASTFAKGVTISGNGIDVTGASKLQSGVEVTGNSTFSANVTVGSLLVKGDCLHSGGIVVGGEATCEDKFNVKGNAVFNAFIIATDIIVSGKVDGRDVSSDGIKLDGIEIGAQKNVPTNIEVTREDNTVTIKSSTGENADIPIVTAGQAGVMSNEDKRKLETLWAGGLENAEIKLETSTNSDGSRDIRVFEEGSSNKSEIVIPIASSTVSGLMTKESFNKLSGIEAGAQKNVGTDLSIVSNTDGVTIVSSTGDNVNFPNASASQFGAMSNSDKAKLDGIEVGAARFTPTHLGVITGSQNITITSSTGNDATLPMASATSMGILDSGSYSKFDSSVRTNTDSTVSANTKWKDGKVISFGDDGGLGIYHTGNTSFIANSEGHIVIKNNVDGDKDYDIYIQAKSGENSIICKNDGNVELYYDGLVSAETGKDSFIVYGDLIPDADNTGNVGTTARTWAHGQFNDLKIDRELEVGSEIKLDDGIKLSFGHNQEAQFYYEAKSNIEKTLVLDLAYRPDRSLQIRSGSSTVFTFTNTGDFTAKRDITAYSDISLKENIEVIPNALDKVSAIRGVTYDRTDCDMERQAGVIAQEVEKVLPEVVSTNGEGVKSVAYGNLVSLLIEAVKELKSEIEELKKGVN